MSTHSDNPCGVDTDATIRLATERHSFRLSRSVKDIGDGYALSSKKLPTYFKPSLQSQPKQSRGNQNAGSSIFNDDDILTSIAHSYVHLGSQDEDALASIEVFAISCEHQALSFNPTSPTNNNSKPSHAKTKSETSISGLSLTESVKEDLGSNITEDVPRVVLSYYLLIKTRYIVENNASNDMGALNDVTKKYKTMTEIAPLDFRPSIVHLRELSVKSDTVESHGTLISAIGIFITSPNDNRLRLYVATRKSVAEQCKGGQHPVKSPCFSLASLSFDRMTQDESDEHPVDPFIFNSSITALDTFGEERLAVALFDGTIHIMSYYLKYTGSLDCIKCHMHCSTFIVDGPVITVHFGLLNTDDTPSRAIQMPLSNVFLVAGSLCGFVCLFYEKTNRQNHQTCVLPSYGGPISIVDELYDPSHGNEDCVVSVHVCCLNHANPTIAIGTQRGRILVFQRIIDEKYAFDETAFFCEAKSKQDCLVSKIAEIQSEIDSVSCYMEDLQMKPQGLETSIVELYRELELLQTSTEASNEMLGNIDDDQSDEFIGDIQIEPFLLISRIQSLESELSDIRDEIRIIETKMVGLESELKITQNELQSSKNDTIATLQLSFAKMHRYELVSYHNLPYPVYGMHYHLGDLIVLTRCTIHIFYKIWSSGSFVEERLASFEKKIAAMLET